MIACQSTSSVFTVVPQTCHPYVTEPSFRKELIGMLTCCPRPSFFLGHQVVSGTAVRGTVRVGDTLLLGPDSTGKFEPVGIKGIHRRRMPTSEVRGGQAASFALKKIKRAAIRKGMVLVHPSLKPVAHWEFDAEVVILHHPTTITTKYQAMVHAGSVRQTAAILEM
jgi:GTPase